MATGPTLLADRFELGAQIGEPVPAAERAMLGRTERRGKEQIGESFDTGRERGRRTPLDQTVELSRDVA